MALKRRTKVNEVFSMASMTDVIFLLLIFQYTKLKKLANKNIINTVLRVQ